MGDYAKARIYLEMAESLIRENNIPPDGNYINLLNSFAITYGSLGITDKEAEYFNKGLRLASGNPSEMAFNLYNNYAAQLGREGEIRKGENVLSEVVSKAAEFYGRQSRAHIEALKNYAIYLTDFTGETKKVLALYNDLLEYSRSHEKDVVLNTQILSGYARILFRMGELKEALVIVRDILHQDAPGDLLSNPPLDSLQQDRSTLRILQLKYNILQSLSRGSENLSTLESAANTAELIIAMLDRIRNSITEEESRIVLGDNFRNSYLNAIRDFELCYRKSGNRKYLEKAFEYAERSKVAGLLAATRQMKAVQFHIPAPLAERENALRREIGFYNSRIASENIRENPDRTLLGIWNANLLRAVTERDSLIQTFEKEYPGYYSLKYNTRVPSMKEIPSVVGRNQNYINYVVSDSLLYVFVVNRKYRELLTVRIGESFISNISDLRNLLSEPSFSGKARTEFNRFLMAGTSLYALLIEPAEKYLLSSNLLISPDNLLSYLPFEVLLRSGYQGKEILYRKLNYLMNDYNISYAYSAAFINEKSGEIQRPEERMVAFAPSYPPVLGIDSIFADRQAEKVLYDLPEARNEAEYVAGISGGKVFRNLEATENRFKAEAGKYGIIHLAMHTVVSDQKPMNSAMIFAGVPDSADDGLLRTYEVYGIPMKARMVVLSSCNTGIGALSSGEGILSLARGFLYSGSRSVVMSLWKIDDRSGTEIVKMFYEELRKGRTKSKALRYARNKYLSDADQLKSHPYFWSALVVFGDNSPVFFERKKLAAALILMLLSGVAFSGIYYFRKRR
jgi:CHAT domain-containing protein